MNNTDDLRDYPTDIANGFGIGLKIAVAILTAVIVTGIGLMAWNAFYMAVLR